LDNKHTVFGRLVGGTETLTELERVEVDNKDRPIEDLYIIRAQVFTNPFDEADELVGVVKLQEYKTVNINFSWLKRGRKN